MSPACSTGSGTLTITAHASTVTRAAGSSRHALQQQPLAQ
jgi:hypothetical protein